jgi:cobalt transport protein ATP-binding subunit
MITVNDLCFQYTTGNPVLDRITLTVDTTDYLAVIGPSGSGKSTLCYTLNGIIPNSIAGTMSGQVTINSMNTKAHKVYELADTVGIVLQNPEAQLFAMSIEEELAFGPENLGIPREEISRRIDNVLTITGLKDRERFPFSLSGGEKQKLAIASILTMQPSYLVLDEPTSQLDPKGRQAIYSVLHDLYMNGMSIILVEHDTEKVAEHAKRVVVLKNGRIVEEGTPKEVFSQVDALKELGVQVPEVAEFTCELYKRGVIKEVCVTVDEALSVLTHIKNKKNSNSNPDTHQIRENFKKSNPVIEVKNLSFAYQDTPVLHEIDLNIHQGEIVAIVGQNGSGKTTLVKHFNGLLRPNTGDILVSGEPIAKKSVAEMARTVGYVFQNPDHQIFADTVFEEVEFGLKNLGVPVSTREEVVTTVLRQTGLHQYTSTHPTSLSGGEKQRLAIASILVMNPQILILDEPTTGLDLKSSQSIIALVKELHRQAHTVVLVTHDMKLVAEMAQRIIVLKQGEIIADGTPKTIFSDKKLLDENFLEPPQIAVLSQALGYGTCLTVDELLQKVVA